MILDLIDEVEIHSTFAVKEVKVEIKKEEHQREIILVITGKIAGNKAHAIDYIKKRLGVETNLFFAMDDTHVINKLSIEEQLLSLKEYKLSYSYIKRVNKDFTEKKSWSGVVDFKRLLQYLNSLDYDQNRDSELKISIEEAKI